MAGARCETACQASDHSRGFGDAVSPSRCHCTRIVLKRLPLSPHGYSHIHLFNMFTPYSTIIHASRAPVSLPCVPRDPECKARSPALVHHHYTTTSTHPTHTHTEAPSCTRLSMVYGIILHTAAEPPDVLLSLYYSADANDANTPQRTAHVARLVRSIERPCCQPSTLPPTNCFSLLHCVAILNGTGNA